MRRTTAPPARGLLALREYAERLARQAATAPALASGPQAAIRDAGITVGGEWLPAGRLDVDGLDETLLLG